MTDWIRTHSFTFNIQEILAILSVRSNLDLLNHSRALRMDTHLFWNPMMQVKVTSRIISCTFTTNIWGICKNLMCPPWPLPLSKWHGFARNSSCWYDDPVFVRNTIPPNVPLWLFFWPLILKDDLDLSPLKMCSSMRCTCMPNIKLQK